MLTWSQWLLFEPKIILLSPITFQFSTTAKYINIKNIITKRWLGERRVAEKPLIKHKITTASIPKLKRLLPKIFPMQSEGLSISIVAEILVKSSGNDVMAESNTPPKKAPERRVERSIISM
jgi:hypothetical protein